MDSNRIADVRRFYEILSALETRVGGATTLSQCNGRMAWPSAGVYFFFEPGEVRSTSGIGRRVVRIGTHGLRKSSKTTLWHRLGQHRGVARTGGGNHRGSIFRLLVGEALVLRDGLPAATWGSPEPGDLSAANSEHAIELLVTKRIGAMPFLCVAVGDPPGPLSKRGLIERNAIALLSNASRAAIDPAASSWLGKHSGRDLVRRSGLWNNNHVEEEYSPSFLEALAKACDETQPIVGPS